MRDDRYSQPIKIRGKLISIKSGDMNAEVEAVTLSEVRRQMKKMRPRKAADMGGIGAQ